MHCYSALCTFLPPLIAWARLADIDERESFMLDSFLNRLFQISEFRIDGMGSKCAPSMLREFYRIEWKSRISCGGRLRDRTDRSRRRGLSCGECVVLIIKYYIRDIEISAT